MEKEWNIGFMDLFRGVNFHDDDVKKSIVVPDDFYQKLLDYFMERSYLNETEHRQFVPLPKVHGQINWLRITHLPINPSNDASYDLLGRWQSVLSTIHSWNYRLLFLLLRHHGETRLYLGTTSFSQTVSAADAVEQLREAAVGSMPGVGLEHVGMDNMRPYKEILEQLMKMPDVGAVTGIPSFRTPDGRGGLQTLDSLAFGLRDQIGMDRSYALLVVADPLKDQDVAGLISRQRELGSKIHSAVSRTISDTRSAQEGSEKGMGVYGARAMGELIGPMVGNLLNVIPVVGPALGTVAKWVGAGSGNALVDKLIKVGIVGASANLSKDITRSSSASVSTIYLDKYAQYAELLTDKHIQRLQEGRNLGFWNTGIYVLGSVADIRTVTGILRSIYSGRESYIEPIRTHLFDRDSGAKEIVIQFDILPLVNHKKVNLDGMEAAAGNWHILGKPYQYLSTPMNTAELSLATSLPRRDVPGLRFVKTAIRFASNPSSVAKDAICLGKVVDMGVVQDTPYLLDPNTLVRHAFVCGVTGCGKTTTCKNLVSEVMDRDIPVLIIEPAKDDYVRWAIERNQTLPPEKQIRIFMPGGTKHYPGAENLHINLFQPAAFEDANIDLLQHGENLSMLLNACLPSEEVIPILIDEVIQCQVEKMAGRDLDPGDMRQLAGYSRIDGLVKTAEEVIDKKEYVNKANIKEILLTRFNYLRRGIRGSIFNTLLSTDYSEIFSGPAVINISRLAGAKEKSLVMSLLLLALYEYRMSAYQNNSYYRSAAQRNRLMHLTLIEEAHNVLSAPPASSSGDPRQAAADLFSNILSEIRGYGEGIVTVDQTPAKMLPDVIKNTNLKICHRLVAPDDCEVMSAGLALREDQRQMIPALEIGNAIICGDMDDAAAWVRMPPPGKR